MMRVVAAGIPRPGKLVRSESLSRGLKPGPATASNNYQSLTAGRMAQWHGGTHLLITDPSLSPQQGWRPYRGQYYYIRILSARDRLQSASGQQLRNPYDYSVSRPGRLLFTSQR